MTVCSISCKTAGRAALADLEHICYEHLQSIEQVEMTKLLCLEFLGHTILGGSTICYS